MNQSQPNEQQRIWRERVRSEGSIIDYNTTPVVEIHHPAGRTAKQDGVHIGHWYILPLVPGQHKMIDEGASGLTRLKTMYEQGHMLEEDSLSHLTLHEFELHAFELLVTRLRAYVPFDPEVMNAIRVWRRH